MSNFIKFFFLCFLSFFLIANSVVQAGIIQQVKNDKVLMTLDDAQVQIGDQFYGINSDKKRTSILEITTVKNLKAVAKIIKGTAQVNDTTEIKSTAVANSNLSQNINTNQNKNPNFKSPSFIRHDQKKVAVSLLLGSDTISTQQKDSSPLPQEEKVDMKGNQFGLNLSIDLPFQDWIDIRAFAGFEMLKIKATALYFSCDGKTSKDCNANINYLTLGGILRLKYIKSNMEFWTGLGTSFKQPISKQSTALTESNIAMANSLIVALGLDYNVSNNYFIPVSFEYHKSFNESDSVPSIMHSVFSLGFGFMF